MVESLLPPSASDLERAIEAVNARMADLPVDFACLWHPYDCPAELLPWLAWSYSVDTWDSSWSERTKRNVIAQSYQIHRRKGTVGSVKRALAAAGFQASIVERLGDRKYNGEITYNGHFFHGWEDAWAMYRVILQQPIRNDQISVALAILASTAPARSQLLSLDYQQASNLYDGRSSYDGAYNYGTA
jgi:phage tail P2-like protein